MGSAFLTDLEAWLHRDVNRTATAARLNYASRQTFDLRLNRLVRNFAALWCHQVSDTWAIPAPVVALLLG